MIVAASFTNPPNISPADIDQAAVVRDFMAGPGKGFREVWYYNPSQPGSGGTGMRFPSVSRAAWLAACHEAAKAGAVLVPYIGGGATGDIPSGSALIDAIDGFRGSPAIACDQVADDPDGSPAEAEAQAITAAGFRYHPEGNSKASPWIDHAVRCGQANPCGEWWMWDLPIPGANMTWHQKRYTLMELTDMAVPPTVIIGRDNNDKGAGFPAGMTAQQWGRKKVELVETYRGLGSPIRIILRPTNISRAELARIAALS